MGKITNFFIATRENNYHPPVLSYKAFIVYAILLLLLRLFLMSAPAAGSAVESATLERLINAERTARNLSSLLTNAKLAAAAQAKSEDMLKRGYFAHLDPDGNYIWERIVAAGYTPYKILGENLAIDFATAEGMVKAWIDSPSHRANLLNSEFVDQGLTAMYGTFQERYTNVTTSLFGALFSTVQKNPPVAKTPPAAPARSEPAGAVPEAASKPTADGQLTAPLAPDKYTVIGPQPTTSKKTVATINQPSQLFWARLVFTLFGVVLLAILAIDTIIIYGRGLITGRSYSSYHFLNFFLLVIISILIWWW